MSKKEKVLDILTTIFMIVCIITTSTSLGMLIYSNTANKMEYKSAPIISITNARENEPKENREYYREQIGELVNVNVYIYKEKATQQKGYYGKTYIIPRVVIVDSSIDITNYIFTLTHELMHLKHKTSNERFTNFQTFKVLYESNIPDLQYVALWYAKKDMAGRILEEYSCWGHISEYLQNQ